MKQLCYLLTLIFAFTACTEQGSIKVKNVTLENVEQDSSEIIELPPAPDLYKQNDTSILDLDKEITLIGILEKFKKEQHRIDTCLDEFKQKYICKIDDKPWYGLDRGLELPKNQLVSLAIIINGNKIPLETSGMFNPHFGHQLTERQFSLNKKNKEYQLSGYFSDGAGTYEASWKISDGKSKRTALYNPGY
jgi:hypothetical protein